MIYADHAATTRLAPEALNTMMPYLTEQFGNASQPYSFGRKARKALQTARETIANCIHALPEEIYFTSGGTESDNWALKGVMYVYGDQRTLITSAIEHHAVLNAAAAVERMGYPVAYLPVTSEGIVLPSTLEEIVGKTTKLVSIMLVNNEVGTIQPIHELADIAHKNGALFHTDAVQALGHIPIDVDALGVDLLSASAHKFNGPKGVGFLYIRKGTHINAFNDGGAQEFGLRAGTENIASIVGMAEALRINCEAMERNSAHILLLEKRLLTQLKASGLEFRRNGTNHVPGNISLSFRNAEGEMLLHRLDLKNICVSTGSACNSKNTQISHVLRAMQIPECYAIGTIRISLGVENTEDEIDAISNALCHILKQ